jgi:type IV secretion system protein VirB3/type IV secretion system protein VirB4
MDAPRSIPIRQSLLRPELVLGGEREPVMLSTLLSLITGVVGAVSFSWVVVLASILFWSGSIWMFRRMAKADPLMTRIWLERIGYSQNYYPAGTSVWFKGGFKC